MSDIRISKEYSLSNFNISDTGKYFILKFGDISLPAFTFSELKLLFRLLEFIVDSADDEQSDSK